MRQKSLTLRSAKLQGVTPRNSACRLPTSCAMLLNAQMCGGLRVKGCLRSECARDVRSNVGAKRCPKR